MLYSRDPEADRAFLREVLGWPSVEGGPPGEDWPIFRLPPTEAGVHPTDGPPSTALYLLCDDLDATLADLAARGVTTTGPPEDQGWGRVTGVVLPSGAELGLYEARHPTAYDLTAPGTEGS